MIFSRRTDRQPRFAVEHEVFEFLRMCVREYGQTIVMVTHDPRAASFADRVLVLSDGSIVQDLDHPSYDTFSRCSRRTTTRRTVRWRWSLQRQGARNNDSHWSTRCQSAFSPPRDVDHRDCIGSLVRGRFVLLPFHAERPGDAADGHQSDHDVYVRGTTEEQNDSSFATSGPISSGTSYNKIDTSLVTQIEQVKGIDNVSPPERTIGATLLDHDGNAVVTTGAPTLMISASSEHPWRAANFIAGTYATGEHEIALSQDAAKKAGLQVGDTTRSSSTESRTP